MSVEIVLPTIIASSGLTVNFSNAILKICSAGLLYPTSEEAIISSKKSDNSASRRISWILSTVVVGSTFVIMANLYFFLNWLRTSTA